MIIKADSKVAITEIKSSNRIKPKKQLTVELGDTNKIIIIGIDPSTVNFGYCVFEYNSIFSECKILDSGAYENDPQKKYIEYTDRYTDLYMNYLIPLIERIKTMYPNHTILGAVEWLIPYITGYQKTTTKQNKNGDEKTTTSMKTPSSTIQLAGCGGAVRLLFKMQNIEWLDFEIHEVKSALTQKGNASKTEIISAVGMVYKILCQSDHEADAISVATAAYIHIKNVKRDGGVIWTTNKK